MDQPEIDFESHRGHLRGVAYRMLGSLSEADDAVQETWLRLARAAPAELANPRGWLTTVVSRVCLDLLRSRAARREDSLEASARTEAATGPDAEAELVLADSVGLALLVVLDRLEPAERLAFVLHDLLGLSFDEVAAIVGRSSEAARQLASRARRRVQGAAPPAADLAAHQAIVERFIEALRRGDLDAVLAVLDPEVIVRAADPTGTVREARGARRWAEGAIVYGGAMRHARAALVDGEVGLVMAPGGRLFRVLRFAFGDGVIRGAEVIMERARLEALEIAPLVLAERGQ